MAYDRIVIGSDLSDEAAVAAAFAVRLGHPRTRYRVTFVRPDPWPPLDRAPRLAETRRMLDVVREWASRAGVPNAETSVPFGSASRALVRDAEAAAADLIVLGHKGETRAPRRLLGSTARAVLRAGTLDTLIVRGGAPLPREPILQTILVTTDFHAPSEIAADRARSLAKQHESDVLLVHAIDTSLWYDPGVEEPEQALDGWLESELQERLTRFNQAHLDGRAREALLHGRPAVEITNYARKHDVQLIVIGNHGAGAFERAVIGSTAETIAELADCSVLVVRAGGS